MIIRYTLLALTIYICAILIIGIINFNDIIKKYITITLSIIYNVFMGYIDTFVILLLYGYFTNRPKGSGYSVPESEARFNFLLGLITLGIYLMLLIPINYCMKKFGKVNLKIYSIINGIATMAGIMIFWIFLDKNRRLF